MAETKRQKTVRNRKIVRLCRLHGRLAENIFRGVGQTRIGKSKLEAVRRQLDELERPDYEPGLARMKSLANEMESFANDLARIRAILGEQVFILGVRSRRLGI